MNPRDLFHLSKAMSEAYLGVSDWPILPRPTQPESHADRRDPERERIDCLKRGFLIGMVGAAQDGIPYVITEPLSDEGVSAIRELLQESLCFEAESDAGLALVPTRKGVERVT